VRYYLFPVAFCREQIRKARRIAANIAKLPELLRQHNS
jgi:hypothetical protein